MYFLQENNHLSLQKKPKEAQRMALRNSKCDWSVHSNKNVAVNNDWSSYQLVVDEKECVGFFFGSAMNIIFK